MTESSRVGDRLEVSVALPPGRPSDAARSPAVYVLDAAFNFPAATAAAAWLAIGSRLAGGDFPPAVVVGIGYPTDDLREVMTRRARDLTPTDGGAPDGVSLPPFPLGLGGAERFLDALLDEVIPEVEARFPVDPADRTLVGHSFGGLFALCTLFSRPAAFGRYLVVSPSIWWDDRVVLRREQAWADAHADLPARVFLAVGGEEQEPGGGWRNEGLPDEAIVAVRQVDNSRELAGRLEARRYPGLDLEAVVLEGEHHLTVGPAAITRGLSRLFAPAASGGQRGEGRRTEQLDGGGALRDPAQAVEVRRP